MALRTAIVGCGVVGLNVHIPVLLANQHVNVTCVCDSDVERVYDASEKFDIPKAYTNVTELIEEEELDLIHICTPPSSHLNIGLKALDAGCHVLIEKPFTLRLSEADELIEKAESVGKKISTVHNLLFTTQMLTTIKRSMELGDIIFIDVLWGSKTKFTRSWLNKLPGGRLGENLPHPVYCMLSFMDKPEIMNVQTLKLRDDSSEPFDELHVSLKGRKALSSLNLTNNSQRPNTIILSGTKGSLMTRFSQFQKMDVLWANNEVPPSDDSGHTELINRWVESIINGTESPITPFQMREVVRIYEEIWSRCLK